MTARLDDHPNAKTRVATRREGVERLLDLSAFLPAGDRALVEQVFRRGASAVELGKLGGDPPRRVRYRLRRILRRVRHPLFNFAAGHMDLIPHRSRPAVRLVIFHGLSLRHVARRRGEGLHVIRRQIRAVHELAQL